jgi:hypothetical protein
MAYGILEKRCRGRGSEQTASPGACIRAAASAELVRSAAKAEKRMAKSSRQAAFDREFRGHLEKFTPKLVPALRKLVTARVPRAVKVLAFEMQVDWREFPVRAFAMDDEAPDEVYFKPPFSGPVLPDVGALIPEGALDQDGYEKAGVATFERGAAVMAEWFGECWHAAGGAAFPIPAYISLHDSSRYFDLRARRWVRDEDIWSA